MRLGNGRAQLSWTLSWSKAVSSHHTGPCSGWAGEPHLGSPVSPPLQWELQAETGTGVLQELLMGRSALGRNKRRQTSRTHFYACTRTHARTHATAATMALLRAASLLSCVKVPETVKTSVRRTAVNAAFSVLHLAGRTHNQEAKPWFSGRMLHL